MSNIEQVQQVSNSPILWLLCGVTVVISAIQTVLYMRQCSKTTRAAGLDPKIPKEAFRVGLISAIGPALGVFIVMVGLMASIGGPMHGSVFPSSALLPQSFQQPILVQKHVELLWAQSSIL